MEKKLVEKLMIRGVPVYRFYEKSTDAIDAYLQLIDTDIQAHIDAGKVKEPMAYALDVSRSGMFSISYMRERVAVLSKNKPQLPVSYIAYVTNKPNDSILVNLINVLTARELDHTRKIFTPQAMDQAIDWLLQVGGSTESS